MEGLDQLEIRRQTELGDTFGLVQVDDKKSKAGVKAGDYKLARIDIITDWRNKGYITDRQAQAGLMVRDVCEEMGLGTAISQYDGIGVSVRAVSTALSDRKIDAAGHFRMLKSVLGHWWEPVYQLCAMNARISAKGGKQLQKQRRESARLLELAADILGIKPDK
tara:strand:- start:699 stop:1190 length:492 start_codon:yes stop_codon:yes gene_type:complete